MVTPLARLWFFGNADAGRRAIVEAGLCELGQSLIHDISCTIQLHVNSCCGICVTAQFVFSEYSTYGDEILKPDESGKLLLMTSRRDTPS